jgi:hypothetical protein
MNSLVLDPTQPAWATALVIFEALKGPARARFLLGDFATFDSVILAAQAAGVGVRHAPGDRLKRAKPWVGVLPSPENEL